MEPIVDFHCHVYPEKIAAHAAAAVAAFYRAETTDVKPANLTGTPEVLAREEEQAGIAYQVIHSVATTPHQVGSVNGFLFRLASTAQGRLIPFGTLHPDCEAPEREVDEILSMGMKGVKMHPDMQGFAINEPRSFRLLEACGNRLIVLYHTGDDRYHFSNPEELIPALEAFPETTFVGAHMGGYTMWEEATRALAGRYENLYVDISSTMFALPPEKVRELVRAYGADRVLFGTDFPMWRPKEELARFYGLELTHEEERKILYNNAAKLLNLPKPEY